MADADMDVDDKPTATTAITKAKKEGKDSSKARFEVKKVSNGGLLWHPYCDGPDGLFSSGTLWLSGHGVILSSTFLSTSGANRP